MKDKKHQIKNEISYLDDEIDIYTVSKTTALEAIEEEDSTENSETSTQAKEVHRNAMCQIKGLLEKKKNKRQVKLSLEGAKQQRTGDEEGIENLLFEILEKHNIKKQSFHGGAMNGVCSRRLLDNIDSIFGEIYKIIENKMSKKKSVSNTCPSKKNHSQGKARGSISTLIKFKVTSLFGPTAVTVGSPHIN